VVALFWYGIGRDMLTGDICRGAQVDEGEPEAEPAGFLDGQRDMRASGLLITLRAVRDP
jgi:hypothetical protein